MSEQRFTKKEFGLMIFVFLCCLYGAYKINPQHCPDEASRQLLSNWMFSTGTLPTGFEKETAIPGWNFSYAVNPYFPSMLNYCFMKLVSYVSLNSRIMLVASRLCSVISITFCCYFCLRIGKILFRDRLSPLLFATIVCLTPQIMFLGMYHNNDSLGLASVSAIIYFTILNCLSKWEYKHCFCLAVAYSVCMITYYNEWAWILASGLFTLYKIYKDDTVENKIDFILWRILCILSTVAVLTGWYFVRNAMLYNGDFLGLVNGYNMSRLAMEGQGLKTLYIGDAMYRKGISFINFIKFHDYMFINLTIYSFFGKFGYMDIDMPKIVYNFYFAVTACFVSFFLKIKKIKSEKNCINVLPMLCVGSTVIILLHICHSYFRDFQPQGRYIISVIFLLAYIFVYSVDAVVITLKSKIEDFEYSNSKMRHIDIDLGKILNYSWIIMFIFVFRATMKKMFF